MLYDAGVFGLGVMGRSLALNFASRGWKIAACNRPEDGLAAAFRTEGEAEGLLVTEDLTQWLEALKKPRILFLMVTAGKAADAVIGELLPRLSPGDCLIDGGNSFWRDTQRRCGELEEKGILFLGCGVSGGESGARKGPSMMVGGSPEAWALAEPLLTSAAAVAEDGKPCCGYLGRGGAGHFVKMVHNGIEYGEMGLLCEAYGLLRSAGYPARRMAGVFEGWNRGRLRSYLTEITGKILRKTDADTGLPLVDVTLDEAGQKRTGCWTVQEALSMDVAVPTIAQAVFSRYISAARPARLAASRLLKGPRGPFAAGDTLEADLEEALFCGRLVTYAQGFALLAAASREMGWDLPLGEIALLWREGSILRSSLLEEMAAALETPLPAGLLGAETFAPVLASAQDGWRRTAALGAAWGVPLPCTLSALAYYDGFREERSTANLLQAQRDCFGAHTYRRVDKPGAFHTLWEEA